MRVRELIQWLERMAEIHGDDLQVVVADDGRDMEPLTPDPARLIPEKIDNCKQVAL